YLAKPLGLCCSSLPWFRSKHYCGLESSRHRGMPHILADYLAAYDRDRKALSSLPYVALTRLVQRQGIEMAGAGQTTAEGERRLGSAVLVNTRRVIASLKQVREKAGMTLPQVADAVGLDPEDLGLLEEWDLDRSTLGTLRGYVLSLEGQWGWSLAERG